MTARFLVSGLFRGALFLSGRVVSLIPKIWAPRSRRDQGEAKPSAELVSGQQGAAHGDVWLPGRRLSEAP